MNRNWTGSSEAFIALGRAWTRTPKAEREEWAKKLREMPYEEFLKTPYWDAIKSHLYRIRGRRCQTCDRRDQPTEIHHLTYAHRGKEFLFLEDLAILCADCHEDCHFNLGERSMRLIEGLQAHAKEKKKHEPGWEEDRPVSDRMTSVREIARGLKCL